MGHDELATQAAILAKVATEAADEYDAVREHPEVIDVLRKLSRSDRLGDVFRGEAGDDPSAYLLDLADSLEPFREQLMDDEPELIERLLRVAALVHRAAERVLA
jgi:hypothetical protein